ncbi:MAG: phospholipase D-like domain-containing protein [Pirellulaceae bacterium]
MEIISNHLEERCFSDFLTLPAGSPIRLRFAVAFFTSPELIDEVAAASPENQVYLVVSLNPPTSYHALKKILWRSNVRIDFVPEGLHSKIYIIESDVSEPIAAVGSSNLTVGGLMRNIETNVLFRGTEVEQCGIKSHFDFICQRADALTPEALEDYRQEFEEFRTATASRNRAKSLLQPQTRLRVGAAKSFLDFWNAAYCVHELVRELSAENFPEVPVYTTIDYFWHYVVSIIGAAEVTASIKKHGRDDAIRHLFSSYATWENEGEQYWRVLNRKVELIQSLLGDTTIQSLTKPLARDVYASLHSNEMAIQRFGRDKDFIADNSIEEIIDSFSVLLHGDQRIEFRIDAALTTHKLKHFGPSGVQELNGWFRPTRYPVRNSLAEKALSVLQIARNDQNV